MLRGLDSRGAADDEQTIIKVAGRTSLDAEITVYVDASADGDAADRQERLAGEFERFESAGVVETTNVVAWQEADVGAAYDEFVDAVGAAALEPFFEDLAGGNALDVPHVCVAIREDGDLVGLYPRTNGRTNQSVEDCLRALASGDRVRNV